MNLYNVFRSIFNPQISFRRTALIAVSKLFSIKLRVNFMALSVISKIFAKAHFIAVSTSTNTVVKAVFTSTISSSVRKTTVVGFF